MYESKKMRMRRSSSHAGIIKTVTVNATSLFAEIRGLKPFTPYMVWILAFTSTGDGPPTNKMEVWTDEDGKSLCAQNY